MQARTQAAGTLQELTQACLAVGKGCQVLCCRHRCCAVSGRVIAFQASALHQAQRNTGPGTRVMSKFGYDLGQGGPEARQRPAGLRRQDKR